MAAELMPAQPVGPAGQVELDHLTVSLGRREVLKNLSGQFSGRCVGLLGPNGAGKTTLIHTLLGFCPPTSGTARIFGFDIRKDTRAVRTSIGYMPERDAFLAEMSAVHFVRFMAELSGLPPEAAIERAHEALFYVGLGEVRYRPIGSYSLGMRQMAKLAQAIVHGPRLVFLDEPTNGLDPIARRRMLDLIRDIRDSGRVQIVLSSHLLRDVEECCDEIVILRDGHIAATCNLEEERRANRQFIEMEIRGSIERFAESIDELGCKSAVTGQQRVKAILPEGVAVRDIYRIADRQGVQIRRLNFKRDSLEDIFLKVMEFPS